MAARVFEREVKLFRQHTGVLRMAEALRLDINRKTLYAMRDAGVVEHVSRGVYRLAALEPLAHPDLVTVAKRVPQGVLCLISALSFHELTTQVPHTIDVALERGTRKPGLDYPPTRFFWFSGPAFHDGIETRELDGVPVRIQDPEKTAAPRPLLHSPLHRSRSVHNVLGTGADAPMPNGGDTTREHAADPTCGAATS